MGERKAPFDIEEIRRLAKQAQEDSPFFKAHEKARTDPEFAEKLYAFRNWSKVLRKHQTSSGLDGFRKILAESGLKARLSITDIPDLAAPAARTSSKRGRPKKSVKERQADYQLIDQVEALVEGGLSRVQALERVAQTMPGSADVESKVRKLKRWKEARDKKGH